MEPPCGQLNPTRAGMYEVLETIYRELAAMFGTKQLHLGGDEIHIGCWNSSQEVARWLEERGRGREEADFMYLWHHYLQQSLGRVQRAGLRADTAQLPRLVYWTNGLTKPDYIHYLDPGLLAVQVWSSGQDTADPTIKTVAEAGFKMIFSNYDATYLDCGFGGWVSAGNNWCSPYKEWQLQHQNDPYRWGRARRLQVTARTVQAAGDARRHQPGGGAQQRARRRGRALDRAGDAAAVCYLMLLCTAHWTGGRPHHDVPH